MIWYLDTSAALKLLVEEPESAALAREIAEREPELVAGILLETEMRRAARRLAGATQMDVSDLLEHVTIHAMPVSTFRAAGQIPGTHVRSLDALHLACAVAIDADAVLTYDDRMIAAAREMGIATVRV